LSLSNEQAVLTALKNTDIPVPGVIWYGSERNEVLIVEAIVGQMIWDYIDPRRESYDREKAHLYLHAYGKSLAQIHNLDITWSPQKRLGLYGFIGEEKIEDERFRRLVAWIKDNNMVYPGHVFVHGDFNTASVLIQDDSISGVIDWEFAGRGWREYDLAWALRARSVFLNTEAERDAILDGYRQCSTHDEEALRWCEVLNYLHFAYWSKEKEPAYTSFALDRALDIAERT
jgi:aminoglycoside phosphotransferase (APT) family kinase protein